MLNLENLNFFKKIYLETICLFVRVDRNVNKTAEKSASIHTNQIFLSSNRLELSPWSFRHIFQNIETTMRWNCTSKAFHFLQIMAKHQDCPFFTIFLTIKTSSQNISTLLQILLKLHEHQGRHWRNSSREWFWKNSSRCWEILLQVK